MAVRIPQSLSTGLQRESSWTVLDYEIREQKAHALGTLGQQVDQALAALRNFDAETPGENRSDRRRDLVDAAAEKVWAFMIQRELCGLRDWDAVVKHHGIPREVLNRVGGARRRP